MLVAQLPYPNDTSIVTTPMTLMMARANFVCAYARRRFTLA